MDMLPSFMCGSTVKTCTGIKVMCDCCFRVKHRVPHKPSNTKQYFWDVPVRYTDPNTAPMISFVTMLTFFFHVHNHVWRSCVCPEELHHRFAIICHPNRIKNWILGAPWMNHRVICLYIYICIYIYIYILIIYYWPLWILNLPQENLDTDG